MNYKVHVSFCLINTEYIGIIFSLDVLDSILDLSSIFFHFQPFHFPVLSSSLSAMQTQVSVN